MSSSSSSSSSSSDENEYVIIRSVTFWTALVFTLLNLWVLLTFLLFPEKRRATWSSLNTAFVVSVCGLGLFVTLNVGIPADQLIEEFWLCPFVGSMMYYFAFAIISLWASITLHLFFRMVKNRDITLVSPMIIFAFAASALATTFANVFSAFQFQGATCMISYDSILWNVGLGMLFSVAFSGLGLWVSITWAIVASLRGRRKQQQQQQQEAAKKETSSLLQGQRSGPAVSSYSYSNNYPYSSTSMTPSNESGESTNAGASWLYPGGEDPRETQAKYLLLFRQFIFVTMFLVGMMALTVLHLSNLINNLQVAAAIECTVMVLMSLDSFLVFGVSMQNYDLWKAYLLQCFNRKPRYAGYQ